MNSGRECSVVSSSKWPFRTDYNPYMVRRFRNFLIRTFYYYNRVSSVPRRLFWFVLSKSNKKSIYRTRSERGQLLNTNFAFQENFSLNMEANKHQVGTYSIKFSDQSVHSLKCGYLYNSSLIPSKSTGIYFIIVASFKSFYFCKIRFCPEYNSLLFL